MSTAISCGTCDFVYCDLFVIVASLLGCNRLFQLLSSNPRSFPMIWAEGEAMRNCISLQEFMLLFCSVPPGSFRGLQVGYSYLPGTLRTLTYLQRSSQTTPTPCMLQQNPASSKVQVYENWRPSQVKVLRGVACFFHCPGDEIISHIRVSKQTDTRTYTNTYICIYAGVYTFVYEYTYVYIYIYIYP